jgi:hypothetical protein
MKVRCLSNQVGKIRYRITVGREYVVLGIAHSCGTTDTHFWIKDDPGNYFVPTPSNLFEIVDPKVSSYWIVKIDLNTVVISAREFMEPLFLDGLTNLDDECVSVFRRVSSILEAEAKPLRFSRR